MEETQINKETLVKEPEQVFADFRKMMQEACIARKIRKGKINVRNILGAASGNETSISISIDGGDGSSI